jgi:LysR family transcriptional regulator, benzoate and cis,cis-muconate-responsive activator of ben and cat genes
MLGYMELRHLRYFVAVAEEENVTRASLKLHVSQPALSRQMRELEEEIGFLLLERTAKTVRLTEAGKVFLVEARAVLNQAEQAVAKARAVASMPGIEINVGYAPSLTIQILNQALRTFQDHFPQVRVALHELTTEEMLTQINSGKLQIALTVRPAAKVARGLEIAVLAHYETCVAVAPHHPLAELESVSLEQISREPLIAYSRIGYPEYHARMEELFAQVGCQPRLAEEHDGITSVIAAVEAGRGFALVPNSVACMVGPRLKLLSLNPALPLFPVVAIWRKSSDNEWINRFVKAATIDQKTSAHKREAWRFPQEV